MALTFAVNDKVDVSGGSRKWFSGVVAVVTPTEFVVKLEPPIMASVFEGLKRKLDGKIDKVTVHRHNTSLDTHKNHIRKRA